LVKENRVSIHQVRNRTLICATAFIFDEGKACVVNSQFAITAQRLPPRLLM
jgi:hypothetical protein